MRAKLAQTLGCDPKLLNVKASSPEGLGALGRGDGMAAAAIMCIEAVDNLFSFFHEELLDNMEPIGYMFQQCR